MTGFADLADLPEDARIYLICRAVIEKGMTVGVLIEDQPAKVERYLRKIRERFPTVIVLDQRPGPVPGVVTVLLGPQ